MTTGISDIPDAMASAVLAGANPVSGLYAIMVGTLIGALFSSSAFMTIAATSAIIVGSALSVYSGEEHAQRLFTLTLLVGIVLIK